MQVTRGKGKLYDSSNNFVDEVSYAIYNISLTGNPTTRWWGEILPSQAILPIGSYIIELEDGHRGPCRTSMNTYSSFDFVVDSVHVEGTGPFMWTKESSDDKSN